ncbi:hypothetical protein EV208_10161 [Christensenella hongkongensis]|nr:hypothetical protein EV208_10161 [Christensenella hongkongensis]
MPLFGDAPYNSGKRNDVRRSASTCWSNCNSTRYGSSLRHPVCPPASADCKCVANDITYLYVPAAFKKGVFE